MRIIFLFVRHMTTQFSSKFHLEFAAQIIYTTFFLALYKQKINLKSADAKIFRVPRLEDDVQNAVIRISVANGMYFGNAI